MLFLEKLGKDTTFFENKRIFIGIFLENRRQKKEDRIQKTEYRRQKTEKREQKTEKKSALF